MDKDIKQKINQFKFVVSEWFHGLLLQVLSLSFLQGATLGRHRRSEFDALLPPGPENLLNRCFVTILITARLFEIMMCLCIAKM